MEQCRKVEVLAAVWEEMDDLDKSHPAILEVLVAAAGWVAA